MKASAAAFFFLFFFLLLFFVFVVVFVLFLVVMVLLWACDWGEGGICRSQSPGSALPRSEACRREGVVLYRL